ncbi:MAG: PIN domain-containing protein [Acidobacteria bacterium]|nr:PIN domain-containing protein [Acidobacteriota bacterium]
MKRPLVVLDTNVVVSALRSRRGAAFQVVAAVGGTAFDIAISVPMVLEYEEALLAQRAAGITERDIQTALDYLCEVGREQAVFFLWRPTLRDPDDDMVLELAVAAGCMVVVTYNVRDFREAARFGVEVWTPVDLLRKAGLLS